jgi:hypothetical protein
MAAKPRTAKHNRQLTGKSSLRVTRLRSLFVAMVCPDLGAKMAKELVGFAVGGDRKELATGSAWVANLDANVSNLDANVSNFVCAATCFVGLRRSVVSIEPGEIRLVLRLGPTVH